jgi:hypothetical protein
VYVHALTKLRLSFIALGVMLCIPLAWLLHSVNERVEAQRRLRHQVVAERIFDELERELTRVLSEEAARPSQAFDGGGPSGVPAYVIGYFRTEHTLPVVFPADSPENKSRAIQALAAAQVIPQVPPLNATRGRAPKTAAPQAVAPAPPQAPPSRASMSPAEVLRKLNRASEERQDVESR